MEKKPQDEQSRKRNFDYTLMLLMSCFGSVVLLMFMGVMLYRRYPAAFDWLRRLVG